MDNKVKVLIAIFSVERDGIEEFSTREVMLRLIEQEPGEVGEFDEEDITQVVETIEEKTRLSKSTVYRIMSDFEDNNIVELQEDSNPKIYSLEVYQ